MQTPAERTIPDLPAPGKSLRLIIDTDIATEIDDLYAVSLALVSPDRFRLEGLIGAHFAQKEGRASIWKSCRLLEELLEVAGMAGKIPIRRGGDPLRYRDEPSPSEGADWIIERARAGSLEDPLWVVGLGAASDLASAILLAPEIMPLVRVVFHARSEQSWPARSEQYNVGGDPWAARILLECGVPLVWFDTGDQLRCPMAVTEQRLAPCGRLGEYLHAYRRRAPYFQSENKGFFDLGDIAWMIDRTLCAEEVVPTPRLDWVLQFHHEGRLGNMRRVHHIQAPAAWNLFFNRMAAAR